MKPNNSNKKNSALQVIKKKLLPEFFEENDFQLNEQFQKDNFLIR
jgi:hypothetical protein